MSTCPNCHSQMPQDANFCGNCGAGLERDRLPSKESLQLLTETHNEGTPVEPPSVSGVRDAAPPRPGSPGLPEPVRELARQARKGRGVEQDQLKAALVNGMLAGEIVFREPVRGNLARSLQEEGWSSYAASFFADRVTAIVAPRHDDPDDHDVPIWDFLIGIPCVLIGAGTTIGTYLSATPGETYVIWWGIIVYGGFRIIRGIARMGSR